MQQGAIDLTLQHTSVDQRDKGLEEHFTDAIEAFSERFDFSWRLRRCKPCHELTIDGVVLMTNDETLRQRVADLPDPNLESAAVSDQSGSMKPDRIFCIGDRLRWWSEQREVGFRTVEYGMKFIAGQIALPRHERQFGVHLRHNLEIDTAVSPCAHQIEGCVGIAAQAVARFAIHNALGDQLRDHIHATRQQI